MSEKKSSQSPNFCVKEISISVNKRLKQTGDGKCLYSDAKL
jgi:hypothetical protein